MEKLFGNAEEIDILQPSGSSIKVAKAISGEDFNESLILFWFDLNGRIVANKNLAKFMTAIDGFMYRRTNGAMVLVSSNLNNSDELQKVLKGETEFVQVLLPVLSNYLP